MNPWNSDCEIEGDRIDQIEKDIELAYENSEPSLADLMELEIWLDTNGFGPEIA